MDPKGDEPVNEAPDDPDRLARVNLQLYKSRYGGVIRYWQGAWYVWKNETRHYERYSSERMEGKIWRAVKEEFNRLYRDEEKQYAEGRRESPPECRKVKETLVRNVMNAMRSRCYISDDMELNRWIENKGDRSDHMISMANGLLDIDAVLANRDLEDCLFPHSPDWFSTTYLPYDFDLRADWDKWDKFLETSMERDYERINVLQEWAGPVKKPENRKIGENWYCKTVAQLRISWMSAQPKSEGAQQWLYHGTKRSRNSSPPSALSPRFC